MAKMGGPSKLEDALSAIVYGILASAAWDGLKFGFDKAEQIVGAAPNEFNPGGIWFHWADCNHAKNPVLERELRKAFKHAQRTHGLSSQKTATFLNDLALCLDGQGRHAEAETERLRVIGIVTQSNGFTSFAAGAGLANMGISVTGQGRLDEGESILRQGLEITSKQFGANHLNHAAVLFNLSTNLARQGQSELSLELLTRARAIVESNYCLEAGGDIWRFVPLQPLLSLWVELAKGLLKRLSILPPSNSAT